jgi:O-antigen/teichoic acid export membrane protein
MSSGLRAQVFRGGVYLAVRQALGTVLSILGLLLLTRIVGPTQYGIYAAAIGILTVVQLIAPLGINVYLIRHEQEIDATLRDTATSVLFAAGVIGTMVLLAATPIFAQITRLPHFIPVAVVLFLSLPVSQLSQVPLALLDRALDYRRMAWVELTSQALFLIVGVVLALGNYGAWALVAGFWAQQLSLLLLLVLTTGYRPRLVWERSTARQAVKYGVAYTGSSWIYQLRRLVNPLVVGRYLGAEAVAMVAVATQIVSGLGFMSVASWRLSTAALARVQTELPRMARAISEGMTLQLLATAPALIVFAFVGQYLISSFMGPSWRPVMAIYPYLAIIAMANAMFTLQSSALYVLRENAAMARYHVAHVVLLAAAAAVLVPQLGITGYGVAELATIAGFYVLHREAARRIAGIRYFAVPRMALKKLHDPTAVVT